MCQIQRSSESSDFAAQCHRPTFSAVGMTETIVLAVLRRGESYGFEISRRSATRPAGRTKSRRRRCTRATGAFSRTGLVEAYWGDGDPGRAAKVLPHHDAARRLPRQRAGLGGHRGVIDSLLDLGQHPGSRNSRPEGSDHDYRWFRDPPSARRGVRRRRRDRRSGRTSKRRCGPISSYGWPSWSASGLPADVAAQRAIAGGSATSGRSSTRWRRLRGHRAMGAAPGPAKPAYVVRTVVLATVAVAALAVCGLRSAPSWRSPGSSSRPRDRAGRGASSWPTPCGRRPTDQLSGPDRTRRRVRRGYRAGVGRRRVRRGCACATLPLPWLVGGGFAVLGRSSDSPTWGRRRPIGTSRGWYGCTRRTGGRRPVPRIPPPRLVSACTRDLWLVALAAFAVLSFTVGWPGPGSPCLRRRAMMITLARTLFAPSTMDGVRHQG